MALENIDTPRLMTQLHGVTSKIELPRGHRPRHMAECNEPVRSGFSEPLPLAVQSTDEPGYATELAKHEHRLTLQVLEEKQRKLALFQEKVNARLRAMKKQERKEKLNDTMKLQNTENILMKCVDPVRKAPLVCSPNIAILQKSAVTTKSGNVSKKTEKLTKCNQYARSKLLGEKTNKDIFIKIPSYEEEEEETESDKENSPTSQCIPSNEHLSMAIQPSLKPGNADQNIRIHRIIESRKAYSLLGREHLKERQKQLDHKRTVEKLRKETEKIRLEAEDEVNKAIRSYQQQQASPEKAPKIEERIHKSVQRNKKISSQTDRQIKRYKSKISSMEPSPPALCPCDENIMQTGPGLCAQNCIFSHNSRLFAQSLASLLSCYT